MTFDENNCISVTMDGAVILRCGQEVYKFEDFGDLINSIDYSKSRVFQNEFKLLSECTDCSDICSYLDRDEIKDVERILRAYKNKKITLVSSDSSSCSLAVNDDQYECSGMERCVLMWYCHKLSFWDLITAFDR